MAGRASASTRSSNRSLRDRSATSGSSGRCWRPGPANRRSCCTGPQRAPSYGAIFSPYLGRAGFRGLALDLPGYGSTRLAPSADHSLVGCADLIGEWLVASGQTPAWVIGHDLGGALAQLLAVRAPHIVARLTLTNSIADGFWPAPRARVSILAARLGLYRPAARLGVVPNPYMRRGIRRAFADPACAERVDRRRVFWDGKVDDAGGRASFQRHLAALSPRDTAGLPAALPALRMPVDLVWGLEDPFQPWKSVGRNLQASLPSARLTLLAGCGHFTPLECLSGCALRWWRPRSDPTRWLPPVGGGAIAAWPVSTGLRCHEPTRKEAVAMVAVIAVVFPAATVLTVLLLTATLLHWVCSPAGTCRFGPGSSCT